MKNQPPILMAFFLTAALFVGAIFSLYSHAVLMGRPGPSSWLAGSSGNKALFTADSLEYLPGSKPIFSMVNTAVEFPGTDDKVDCGNPSGNFFDLTGDATIEAWIKPVATPPAYNSGTANVVLGKDEGPGSTKKWFFGIQSGRLAFHWGLGGSGGWLISDPFTQPALNEFYHVAMVKEGENCTFYMNGTNVGSGSIMSSVIVNKSLTIGFGESCCQFYGAIDEVRYWNTARAQSEIQATMNYALIGSENGLIGYWPLDEGTGGTTADLTGNGNDGTLTNGASWVTPGVTLFNFGLDAATTQLASPQPGYAPGIQGIVAVVTNLGNNAITSLDIDWTFDGVSQAPLSFSGALSPLGDTAWIFLGTKNFLSGQLHEIKVWASNPNGLADENPPNDTLMVVTSPYLSGTYTIGGVNPDFAGFNMALDFASTYGIGGPATFQVRSGTYEEALIVPALPGASPTNTVVFESESGDSSQVVLTSSTGNVTLAFSNAQWATFRKMTIEATHDSHAVAFYDSTSYCSLANNVIRNQPAASSAEAQAVIYAPSSHYAQDISIRNNRIEHGSYGIYFNGNHPGSLVENNFIENPYIGGIAHDGNTAPFIRGNTITTTLNGSGYNGVRLYNCSGTFEVSHNQISGQTDGAGIYILSTAEPDNHGLTSNNFIQVGGSGVSEGIHAVFGGFHDIVFNSVNMTNTNVSSRAFRNNGGTDKKVLNNIFHNSGGGYAVYFESNTSLECDYNDLSTVGANLGWFSSTDHTNLAAWQAAVGLDANSVSESPSYSSSTDLHINSNLLDRQGAPYSGIAADIDGQSRDPVHPDIGADEIQLNPEDAGMLALYVPPKPFQQGAHPIYARIFNNGSNTLVSANIEWSVNEVMQVPHAWTGSLAPGASIDSIQIGNYTFGFNTAHDFKAWTAIPNGMADGDTDNDTVAVNDIYSALLGTYKIGGANPSFPDFTSAVTALDNGGIVGPVILEARDGTYNEAIGIPEISGAGANSTVTFQSESGDSTAVVLMSNIDGPVVNLSGADWIRFRQISIKTTNISGSGVRVMLISGEAANNEFTGNVFEGVYTANWYEAKPLIASGDSNDDSLAFVGNRFINGNFGLHLNGTASLAQGIVIRNNYFENQTQSPISLLDQLSPIITENYFTTNVINEGSGYYSVILNNCTGPFQITKNEVVNITTGAGVRLFNCPSSPSGRGLIANNFIHVGTTGGAWGFRMKDSDNYDIFHNNVNDPGPGGVSVVEIDGGNDINIKNNVFVKSGGGTVIHFTGTYSNVVSDYNDFYAVSSNVGRIGTTDYADLSSWQSASSQDANSISIAPNFQSATDLHVQEIDLNNSAIPLAEVTEDFDGETRSTVAPDIGADEFFPTTQNDMEAELILSHQPGTLFPTGSQPVSVVVKNNGADTIFTTEVRWWVNNAYQPPYVWSGALLPGERDTVDIGDYNFLTGVSHDITTYTYLPNGKADSLWFNDTARVVNRYPALDGAYTIGGLFPDFSDFNAAATTLNLGGVLGPVTLNARNGTYNEQFSLGEIPGASATNRVVFQSESADSTAVTLTHTHCCPHGLNHLVRLSGTDWVTFRKLKLHTPNHYYSQIVVLEGGATNNTLENNWIVSDGHLNTLVVVSNSGEHNNLIQNNRIENGAFGIGQSNGSLYQGPHNQGIAILGNHLINQSGKGVFLRYYDAPTVSGNIISASPASSGYHGIETLELINGGVFYGNSISTDNGSGMAFVSSNGTASDALLVANNMIAVSGGATASYGLQLFGSYADVWFNSISNESTHAESKSFYAYAGANNELKNNIFSHGGSGYAAFSNGSGILNASDFNDIYAGPSATLGKWNGTATATLAEWQAASGMDANSLSVDPLFLASNDLHAAQSQLDSMATPIAGIIADIDGDSRDATHPDIGADEIGFLPDDVGITLLLSPSSGCALSAAETVIVKVQNFSSTPLSGFDLAYQLNENAPVVENIGAAVILPGNSALYTFSASLDLSAFGEDTLKVYTAYPSDNYHANDTLAAILANAQIPGGPTNLIPVDSSWNLHVAPTLSWQAAAHAEDYAVKIWPAEDMEPIGYTATDIAQINYQVNPALHYGDTLIWKVIAKNEYCFTESPEQIFSTRHLPDILPINLDAPDTVFNGQQIAVTWQTHNQGTGATGATAWGESIFLSNDPNFNFIGDLALSSVNNFSALLPGDTSSNSLTATPPNFYVGLYYLILVLDQWDVLPESDNANNIISIPIYFELAPPPDLEVTSIILNPTPVFSGEPLQIVRTVTNTGTGPTVSAGWVDRFYWSQSPIFGLNTANFMFEKLFLGVLDVNESYVDTVSWTPPLGTSGDYYIYITTDIYGSEFEHAFEGNNTSRSNQFEILIQPPPDLIVQSVAVPLPASNGETVSFNYTLKNQGANTAYPNWKDRIFLSPISGLTDLSSAILVGEKMISDTLDAGETLNVQVSFPIPSGLTGIYYIYVQTDADDTVYEHSFENNNIGESPATITIRTPDLIVQNISAPASASSGETISVQWTVKNQSPDATLFNGSWTDEIGISAAPTHSGASITPLWAPGSTATLLPGGELLRQAAVQLPQGISGQHYLYVQADSNTDVYESDENNNVNNNGLGISIALNPWPDLAPLSITPGANPTAGSEMEVTYTIENNGSGPAQGASWTDKIYIQNSPVFNPNTAELLDSLDEIQVLGVGASYMRNPTVTLPANLSAGTYYLFLETDTRDHIFENTGEGNNLLASAAFAVAPYPDVDLAASNVSSPDSVQAGQGFEVNYVVENLSAIPTPLSTWSDGIYLSVDSFYSPATDILLEAYLQVTVFYGGLLLPAGLFGVTVPNGTPSGDYYLFVVADHQQLNPESDYTNNVALRRDTNGVADPIHVLFPPPSDLVITQLSAPASAVSGQPAEIIYQVENQGLGPTLSGNWHDAFFLSTDFTISPDDIYVTANNKTSNLEVGSSYTDTISLNIPGSVATNRILLVATDYYDAEYEHLAEGNNQSAVALNISQLPPADLVVESITAPAMVIAGEQASFGWTVKNQGQNPAQGQRRDALYLSLDTAWQVTDPLLGFTTLNSVIQPQNTESHNLSLPVTGVAVDTYFVLVRTDVLDNIHESNDTNNIQRANSPLIVTVPLLPLDVLMPDTLPDDGDIYYRIEISAAQAGETMLVTLKGDSIQGNNELYLSLNEVPTQVEYDFNFSNAFFGNQEILVPAIQEGVYYIYATGESPAVDDQPITLKAEIVDFEILNVQSAQGGNTGSVTVKVTGAKFVPGMSLRLENGGAPIDAHQVYYNNSTQVFASFDLSGTATGFYDVVAEKTGGETATLTDGFEVVSGSVSGTSSGGNNGGFYCNIENIGAGDLLVTNVQHPGSSRPNRVVKIDVHYGNDGNVDVPVPLRFLISLGGAPLAFEVEGLPDNAQELLLEFNEAGGPPGVLRPGASGTISVYTKAVAPMRFALTGN